MPSTKFEPAIQENELPQTYTSGRTVTGIGL